MLLKALTCTGKWEGWDPVNRFNHTIQLCWVTVLSRSVLVTGLECLCVVLHVLCFVCVWELFIGGVALLLIQFSFSIFLFFS